MQRLREVAERATPGPWRWWGQTRGPMSLVSKMPGMGTPFVMGFKRLGMQEAQPTFATERNISERKCGLMTPASELAVREASYRDDIRAIDNPDAEFIAMFDPDVALKLLAVAEDAEAFLNAARLYEDRNPYTDDEFAALVRSVNALKGEDR